MSRFSLSIRLAVFVSFSVLLVTASLSAVVFHAFANKIDLQINHNLTDIADHKADELNRILQFERINLMSWLSSSVMLDVVVDDLDKRIGMELLNLKNYYHLHGDLYVFNAKKVLIASTQAGVLGNPMPGQWLPENDYRFIFKHHVDYIAGDIIAHAASLRAPQLPEQGYLVMTHSWEDVSRTLQPAETNFALRVSTMNNADLFTDTGVRSIPVEDGFSAQKLWVFDRKRYLGSISSPMEIGNFKFQIAAFVPENVARAPLEQLMLDLFIAAGSVAFPMILLVMLLSRHMVSPIKKLTSTIVNVEDSNDLSVRVVVSGQDEVANLGYAFNRMAEKLAAAFAKQASVEKELENLNANLEIQVNERTTELQQALKKLQSAQAHLVQSEKMVSLGQLVAGIAHEINNPVGAIYANMKPLKEYIDDIKNALDFAQRQCMTGDGREKLQKLLGEIDYDFIVDDLEQLIGSQQQAAERIKNIVLALRNFSRLDQGEVKSVLIEDGLNSTLQMLQHLYKNRVVIEKDYKLNEMVDCCAGEINQVFMNILANAIQAIPKEGVITVKTARQGDCAVVTINDTGIGMSDAVKEKIFDPFFTTKDVGTGTGLGLSISYGIIEKHHGTLTVESDVDKGTTFIISIPLISQRAS
ncbi:ATP-binding protein [Candidatus Methylospira mobilis]|uniref:sensor histidine kinase n=1 Tax=Candidatus Methylospira mobilis TaxID=1808979 RepID=UPI0028E6C913|nr:ATP-binding protein [Candidatus Methylospira mobilis]WNV04823.1 ATP-binding protein [Candidatus Methylospira mobilis]